MLHAVLRVHVPAVHPDDGDAIIRPVDDDISCAQNHFVYNNSSFPEDLTLYILECYNREHPDKHILPENYAHVQHPLSALQGGIVDKVTHAVELNLLNPWLESTKQPFSTLLTCVP